jgi:hypothetical protein
LALDAGIPHETFWRQTPRETAECLRAAVKRRRRAFELALWTAWHAVAFQGCARMPELDPLLARVRGEAADDDQDAEDQMNAARAIAATFGTTSLGTASLGTASLGGA